MVDFIGLLAWLTVVLGGVVGGGLGFLVIAGTLAGMVLCYVLLNRRGEKQKMGEGALDAKYD